ncbi:protein APCDD1-like [Sinocyclocheilus anshuiensis]|uniref:protein APCDD1-like n=1 Tax=Sinocyclocheilus anshuiensis TaxID=1608454 RepID=UPI0007BA6B86|nr:PREDICTED: protein APCDD1-like [Sinocyclocheilus anshuiensis]
MMLSLYSLVILLSSVSVCEHRVGSDPVPLDSSSRCHSGLKQLHGQQVTVHLPPNITGHWVSSSCEVRPGPEFITRSYRFFPDGSFQALQFYYQDPDCSEPSYSLLIRGSVRPLQASWLVRGGAVCEYHLSRVQLLCHGPKAALIQQRLQSACDLRQPLRPGLTYELWDEHFSMQELQLMRLERSGHHGDPSRQIEELFLGDVHTVRAQRRLHQPAGYQTPLQSAKAERCGVCRIVSSADLHHPPVLSARPERPVRLQGDWVSTRCEVRPGVLFLTRQLTFHEDRQTWTGQYEHFSDPVCRHPTFSISASGRYSRGAPSADIGGAVQFTFTVTHMTVTPMDEATASLLKVLRGRACGAEGSWQRGVPQDVTSTSGCAALGVRLPHTEYELFSMGQDPSGRSLLYNGQRPSDGSSPDRPERRPTSFQPPLIRCSTGQTGERRGGREGDQRFTLNASCGSNTLHGLVPLILLLVFM